MSVGVRIVDSNCCIRNRIATKSKIGAISDAKWCEALATFRRFTLIGAIIADEPITMARNKTLDIYSSKGSQLLTQRHQSSHLKGADSTMASDVANRMNMPAT